ncbi:MAG: type II toxin-antitoxin system RelE/ParE family toxin [Pseudomonadota bacterium]
MTSRVRIQEAAIQRLDDIYQYGVRQWGAKQSEDYLLGLFATFDKIADHQVASRPIPAEFGVQGYYYRYRKHMVYWKTLRTGGIGIVTVLHEKMHQITRFQDDFNLITNQTDTD